MGRTTKNPNETFAQKLTAKTFTSLGKVLALIGRPFYLLLLSAVLITLFILNTTGRTFRTVIINLIPKILGQFIKLSTYFASTLGSYFNSISLRIRKTKQIYPEVKGLNFTLLKKYQPSFRRARRKLTIKSSFLNKKLTLFKKSFIVFLRRLALFSPKRLLNIASLKLKLKTLKKIPIKISVLKTLLTFSVLVFLTGAISAFAFWKLILSDLPDPHELATKDQTVSTKIYDRNGVLLYNIYEDENRTPIPLDSIPSQVRLATIAIEDADFYRHPGFSLKGILRAIITNIEKGELTGGSTITQQLVKNVLLTPEKTLVRKIKEVILAVQVESTYSKDEILSMYLNEVSYGGTSYGIQEAANSYFDKDANELTLGEAALLAGLPKSPTKYSPFGEHPETAFARQKEVLRLMRENGFITEAQRKTAEEEKIEFTNNIANIKAPHFVMFTRQLLAEKYGEELVAKGGLEVTTTLDLNIQKITEEAVANEIDSLKNLGVGNGSAIVIDVQTGEILAMVGSKDYFDIANDGNVNLTTSKRQPGSSIKVVNYAYALSHGYTPLSPLEDTPKTFLVDGQPPYTPKNYDNSFRGKITLRSALAESRNVPAVKVLASYGVANMIEEGRRMGITSWTNPENYGLSLTLGGGEVKLVDLANVYATIANYGKKPILTAFKKITDYEGNVFEIDGCDIKKPSSLVASAQTQTSANTHQEDGTCAKFEQALDARVSYMLIDILSDNIARAPSFGSNSLLVIPNHPEVAVKTGTSNDLRDNLTVGFNQKYLVAVWVGNNDNSPMSRVASGITGATPIWNRIMTALVAKDEPQPWQIPPGLISLPVCSITSSLACENCRTGNEWFLEENQPTAACNPEYIKNIKEQKEEEKQKEELFLETANAQP